MPKPQQDRNWCLVRKRCGLTTVETNWAARIAPKPGRVALGYGATTNSAGA
jgi:hypothetical protein